MSPTAVVQLSGQRLELVRHPANGQVIAFDVNGPMEQAA
jgi:hypothetical protein